MADVETNAGSRPAERAAEAPPPPSLPRLLVRLLAAPLVLLAIVAAVLVAQVAAMRRDSAWVDHSDQVIRAAHQLETHLLDQESSLRGYLLTGDEGTLEAFRLTPVDARAAAVRALVTDNAEQRKRLEAVLERHRAWRQSADETVARTSSGGAPERREDILSRKNLMTEVRRELASFVDAEEQLRAFRGARAERSITLTEILVVSSLVALGLLLLLVTRRQVASIVLTFGGALDTERHARAVSDALVDSLERQESFKDTFLAMLGHDLRNPLTAVSMAASYALEQPGLSDKTRGLLGRVVTSGERMGRMVDQLIDLTRARLADSFPVTLAPMDLGELASRIVEEERRAKPRHHFALTREGDLELLGDDERLGQVLLTLVGNAAVHGRTREVQVDVRGRESAIVVRVRNEGDTIPANVAAKLFDPFARGPSDKMRSDGLGLGLYIAQRIVEAHGGSVRVRSEPGADLTEIELELPRKPPRPGVAQP